MSAPLLSATGVETYYGKIVALRGVDVEVMPGEIVTLIGANGAGKSTLMMTICGNPRARAGSIVYDGVDITSMPTHEIMRLGIAQSPEGRQIFPNLSVREHLEAFADNRAQRKDPWTPEKVFELFENLKRRAGNMGNQLSGGEQQMLAIGRALVTNPHLLILDEATEGLAPLVREEIWRCVERLRAAGQTILVIDKYLERLVRLADRHTIIERGRVAWQGSSAELDADRGLWHRYLGV